MANGYFERGEVYWVNMGSGYAAEKGVGRPAVIISKDESNNASPCVMVALFTTKSHDRSWEVYTDVTGRDSWVMCNEVMTYDKARVGKYFGKLTASEMRAVEDGLEEVFDLGYADTEALSAKDQEIEKLKAEIVELTGEVAREQTKYIELQAKHENELLSYKLENTMWQKCYERSMDMLVDTKVNADLSRRAEKLPEQPKEPVKVVDPEEPVIIPKNPPVEVKEDRVDINHCTQTQLKKVGMSDGLARAVVAKRPFQSVADLKNVPGMNGKKFQIFEPKLTCTPLEIIEIPAEPKMPEEPVVEVSETGGTEGKLNINAVSGKELMEATGVSSATAYGITGYRRKNGPYAKLEDIMKVPKITVHIIDRIRDKIYCGPGIEEKQIPRRKPKIEEPTEPYTGPKVNINTATAAEIHQITGLEMTVAYSITGCRKRDGLYRSVEDVRNIPRFSDYHWAKFGQMFEV